MVGNKHCQFIRLRQIRVGENLDYPSGVQTVHIVAGVNKLISNWFVFDLFFPILKVCKSLVHNHYSA